MDGDRTRPDEPSPPTVPGFTLGAVLGRGGFATVWEATPADGGRPLAIKIGHGDGPAVIERFRREAEAMTLVGPPVVPALVTSGRSEDGRPYLVMERLFGETLEARLAAMTRPPDPGWAGRVGVDILDALARVHEKGMLHRDVKPANVFFATPDDRVVLLDLGLTRRICEYSDEGAQDAAASGADELTRTGVAVGTPEYMAPEQIRAEKTIGARADLYAFGVVLHEMLTLQLPFSGAPAAIEHGHLLLRPRRPGELAPVPGPLEELVLACLAKDPARRPESAAALRVLLAEACQSRLPPEPPREVSPPARLIAEGRHPVVVAVIDARGDAAPVAAAVAARGGFVPRQRGARYVAVFSGMEADDPLRAAIAAGRELTSGYGARAALHLADVMIRRRDRGAPAAYGAALDRPETWLPPEPWSGLVWTPEIARILPRDPATFESTDLEPTAESGSTEALRDAHVEAPLTGRERLIDAMADSLTATFESGRPALFTVLGEAGTGKSRIAVEAAALAERAHPAARLVRLAAAPPGAGERDRLTAELLRALRDAPGATLPDGAAPGHHGAVQALAEALQLRASEGPIAVILDDAQWADDAVLDALEYASLDATKCPLWVFVSAHPRLLDLRSGWGARTRNAERVTLAPLDAGPAAELAARLLAPAEYPPAALLDNLARWSGGNPASLTEIVRALKRAGVVRMRPGGGAYVATAALDSLPPSPSWQWLATRRLAALPPELAACLRLGSVLGAAFARDELEAVQAALEQAGGATTTVDAGAGLRALAVEGLLAPGAGERYAFSNALFHDAVYELIDPAQRTEVHRVALEYHRSLAGPDAPSERLERLARHAAVAGARGEAAGAYLRLGDLAAARHRHVEADQHYSAALAIAEEGDSRVRALALKGRGSSRIYTDRSREAVADFTEARALAKSLMDDALIAELLLEEATALDWAQEHEISARRAEEARPLVEALASPTLAARLLVASGRTAWREGKSTESIDMLDRGLAAATEAGDYPSRIIALLCLTWQLASAGRLDEAETRFEDAIALTANAGDIPHLCVAHINRYYLWIARGEPSRAIDDLRRAIALAREIGNPQLERGGCYNVADLLYWSGRTDEAIELARRGCLLAERFLDRPEAWGPLILAMFHMYLGEYDEARRRVDWLDQTTPYDLVEDSYVATARRTTLRVLKLVLAEVEGDDTARGGWDEAAAAAENQDASGSDLLEVLFWRARMALRDGRIDEAEAAMARARPWFARSPLWQPRFETLFRERDIP